MPLDVNVFASTGLARLPHHGAFLRAFHDGLQRAGETVRWVDGDYLPCDVAVVYGYPKPDSRSTWACRSVHAQHRGPVIVIETPFLGRAPYIERRGLRALWRRLRGKRNLVDPQSYARIGIDGAFQDDGDFCNAGSPPDRWQQLSREFGLTLQPFRKQGSQVLLVGQKPGDASLRGADIVAWMIDTARRLRACTDRPIVVRAHPASRPEDFGRMKKAFATHTDVRLDIPPTGTIHDALCCAWAAVTYSSSAAIDALLAGIPAISTIPASMAWPVTDHELSMIDQPTLYPREQWLYDLCYAQWSVEETASGAVWARLKARVLQKLGA
jgi:hypothetical protein